jgi:hypothetical protein
MQAAVKLQVTISKDRLVQLPEDLPEGRAEVIVLYQEAATERARRPAKGAKRERTASRERADAPHGPVKARRVDYFARLTSHQPRPISAAAARALDEADRGER